MMRFADELPHLKNPAGRPLSLSLVTGTLGAKVLKRYFMRQLNQVPDMFFKLHPVINRFYGAQHYCLWSSGWGRHL